MENGGFDEFSGGHVFVYAFKKRGGGSGSDAGYKERRLAQALRWAIYFRSSDGWEFSVLGAPEGHPRGCNPLGRRAARCAARSKRELCVCVMCFQRCGPLARPQCAHRRRQLCHISPPPLPGAHHEPALAPAATRTSHGGTAQRARSLRSGVRSLTRVAKANPSHADLLKIAEARHTLRKKHHGSGPPNPTMPSYRPPQFQPPNMPHGGTPRPGSLSATRRQGAPPLEPPRLRAPVPRQVIRHLATSGSRPIRRPRPTTLGKGPRNRPRRRLAQQHASPTPPP